METSGGGATRPVASPASGRRCSPPPRRWSCSRWAASATASTATSCTSGCSPPAWGYVDQPPLTPWLARTLTSLVADEAWALRIPATLASAASVVLLGLIARELGGDRRAVAFAAWGAAFAGSAAGPGARAADVDDRPAADPGRGAHRAAGPAREPALVAGCRGGRGPGHLEPPARATAPARGACSVWRCSVPVRRCAPGGRGSGPPSRRSWRRRTSATSGSTTGRSWRWAGRSRSRTPRTCGPTCRSSCSSRSARRWSWSGWPVRGRRGGSRGPGGCSARPSSCWSSLWSPPPSRTTRWSCSPCCTPWAACRCRGGSAPTPGASRWWSG